MPISNRNHSYQKEAIRHTMDTTKLLENLRRREIDAVYFDTKEEAAAWLSDTVTGRRVVFGGSKTLEAMGLYERLGQNNDVFWHWVTNDRAAQHAAESACEVYFTSVNACAETGELVNIDGRANRVATSVYGPKETYLVFGINKIAPTLETAILRARNFAAPKNALRFTDSTPCARSGGSLCGDCASKERICRVMNIIMAKPFGLEKMTAVVIGEVLGY